MIAPADTADAMLVSSSPARHVRADGKIWSELFTRTVAANSVVTAKTNDALPWQSPHLSIAHSGRGKIGEIELPGLEFDKWLDTVRR